MKYVDYNSFKDLCIDFQTELKNIHSYSGHGVEGQQCALRSAAMNKLRLFIRWMSTRMKGITLELSAEHLLALTYKDFNVFRQAEMIRMSSEPTSPPPGPTTPKTPFASHTSGSVKRQLSYPNMMIYFINVALNLLKKLYLTKISLVLPHFHPFHLLSILLNSHVFIPF